MCALLLGAVSFQYLDILMLLIMLMINVVFISHYNNTQIFCIIPYFCFNTYIGVALDLICIGNNDILVICSDLMAFCSVCSIL